MMGVVSADEGFQLLDQLLGLVLCDEFGRQDNFNEQLKL